jgi:hypothetical protein
MFTILTSLVLVVLTKLTLDCLFGDGSESR